MPLGPLRIACVRPAPKSRLVSSDPSRTKIKIQGQSKGVRRARFSVAVRLAGGSDFTDATAGKPDCYRGSSEIQNLRSRQRSLLILLFIRDRPDAAERDLGAGRTQVALRGPSGMDAARAAPRHGWRMAAGPRSVAGAEGTRRSRAQPGAKRFWLLLAGPALRAFLPKVTRCKSGTVIRPTADIGYAPPNKQQKSALTVPLPLSPKRHPQKSPDQIGAFPNAYHNQ